MPQSTFLISNLSSHWVDCLSKINYVSQSFTYITENQMYTNVDIYHMIILAISICIIISNGLILFGVSGFMALAPDPASVLNFLFFLLIIWIISYIVWI